MERARLKISVALCMYQGSAWIQEQLASVAAQTRPPDEVVVCDDASHDDGCALVRAFAARAPFPVRLYENPGNLGFVKNFERAIGLCSGDVIALCDQDDVWAPKKLETLERAFADDPRLGLCFSDAELVAADLSGTGKSLWDAVFSPAERREVHAGAAWRALLRRNFIAGATTAFRASLRPAILPIPADIDYIHDGWIAVIAAFAARIEPLPVRLVKYRLHSAQARGVPRGDENEDAASRRERLKTRAAYFAGARRRLEVIRERLTAAGLLANEERRAHLDDLILHMQARAQLPYARIARLGVILRELVAGRYRRHNRGLFSAGKDFLV
jgi:glycosyltransferase involved in cell wall biosynthesis